jgi:hypothetical protein
VARHAGAAVESLITAITFLTPRPGARAIFVRLAGEVLPRAQTREGRRNS